jgi:AraC family transcriptional regulator of adaptative response/methylated-DNA-[protein]-cysteine methyltransferase
VRTERADDPIRWAAAPSDLGWVLAARDGRGVRAILLGDSRRDVEREIRERFPNARMGDSDAALSRLAADAARLAEQPWRAGHFEAALEPLGTPFQRRVWRALREIPSGETTTYAALAASLGLGRGSARAIGAACGANPIAIAIPCHRVVRADGSLAGYRWGLERKRELLRREREDAACEPERAA